MGLRPTLTRMAGAISVPPPALAIVKRNNKASPGVSIPDSGPPSSDVFHPLSAASVPTRALGPFLCAKKNPPVGYRELARSIS
jgi:hypothetical protein